MVADTFVKPSKADQDLKWAKIWFKQFLAFHRRSGQVHWDFSSDDVIAFLRTKRDAEVPAWKRKKILEGLLVYRRLVQERPIDPFIPIRKKMDEIVQVERTRGEGQEKIRDVVGWPTGKLTGWLDQQVATLPGGLAPASPRQQALSLPITEVELSASA